MLFTNGKAAFGVALASALIMSPVQAAPKKLAKASPASKPMLLAAATPTATTANTPGSTSVVTASEIAPSVFSKVTAGVATTFVGPRLGRLNSSFTNDNSYNTQESKLFFDTVANVGYKLDGGRHISLNLPFYYKPVGKMGERDVPAGEVTAADDAGASDQYGGDIETFDPYLRLKGITFVKTDNLTINTDARASIPVKAQSRTDGLISQLRIDPNLDYKISGSRLSLGVATTFRAYAYVDPTRENVPGKKNDPRRFRAYLAPSVNYQITDKIVLNLVYEMAADNRFTRNHDDVLDWTTEGTDLRPALSIDVTPNLYVAPYLEIATGGRIAPETTKIGFDLAASIL